MKTRSATKAPRRRTKLKLSYATWIRLFRSFFSMRAALLFPALSAFCGYRKLKILLQLLRCVSKVRDFKRMINARQVNDRSIAILRACTLSSAVPEFF
jgi:hypothetical protein